MKLIEKALSQQLEGYVNQTTDDVFAEGATPRRRNCRALWAIIRIRLRWSRRPLPTSMRKLSKQNRSL